jgi:glyoxylase-like metal-dependent hydrolase (beta-lactamase superfamily II)
VEVYIIPGIGFDSNVYILKAQSSILIDTGTGFNIQQIISKIEQITSLTDISVIILTHEHFDHTGGLPVLLEKTNAKVVMHNNGATTLEKGCDWSATMFGESQPAIPDIKRISDDDYIKVDGTKLIVFHTPGHSPGSICLYEPISRSLFSGDTVFADGGVGRTDFQGGSTAMLRKSVLRLTKLDVTDLYPGHGPHIKGDGNNHIALAMRTVEFMLL